MAVIPPGTLLGSYEVLAPIGAGGMGEVYRARDTRLGRTVALKVLPERFAADADRIARWRSAPRTRSRRSPGFIRCSTGPRN